MGNFMIIVGIFLAVFAALAIGTAVLLKKNKIRFKENQQDTSEINYFENNKKIWLFNTKTTVLIGTYNFSEVFDQFPFLSDFQESKEMMLKKRGVSSAKVDEIIDNLLTHQSTILQMFQKNSNKLLNGFDKTKLDYNYHNANYLLKFYNVFLNRYKDQISKNFVNKIMIVELNEVFKNITVEYNKDEVISRNLERIFKNLEQTVEIILKKLYEELSIKQEEFKYREESETETAEERNVYVNKFDEFELAYKILGVSSTVDNSELKKAYRSLAMQYHPDKNGDPNASEWMTKINQAYDLISKVRNLK